jgi:hypothetical protein
MLVGKQTNEKYILSLSLDLGGYDFPHPCDGPRSSHLFLKRPLIDTESDMPDLCSCFLNIASFIVGLRIEMMHLHGYHDCDWTEVIITREMINDARMTFASLHEGQQVSKFEAKNPEGSMGVSCENKC